MTLTSMVRMLLAPPGGQGQKNYSPQWTCFYLPVCISILNCLSVCVCVLHRSSRAVLQSDVVPQSSSWPHVHPSDRLSQRPLHSAMGQKEAVHPGSLYWNTVGSGTVSEWITNRSVCVGEKNLSSLTTSFCFLKLHLKKILGCCIISSVNTDVYFVPSVKHCYRNLPKLLLGGDLICKCYCFMQHVLVLQRKEKKQSIFSSKLCPLTFVLATV